MGRGGSGHSHIPSRCAVSLTAPPALWPALCVADNFVEKMSTISELLILFLLGLGWKVTRSQLTPREVPIPLDWAASTMKTGRRESGAMLGMRVFIVSRHLCSSFTTSYL
jgi:hypothetical protein